MPQVSWNARNELGELLEVQGDTDAIVASPGPAELTQGGGATGVGIFDYVQTETPSGDIADGATWLRRDDDENAYTLFVYSSATEGWAENVINRVAGDAGTLGQSATVEGGEGTAGNGGAARLLGGEGTATGGEARIVGGDGATGGNVTISAGDGAAGGTVNITSGTGTDADGSITISTATGPGAAGAVNIGSAGATTVQGLPLNLQNDQIALVLDGPNFLLFTLPTVDPAVAGALWNDTGTVKISAG